MEHNYHILSRLFQFQTRNSVRQNYGDFSARVGNGTRLFYPNPRTDRSEDASRALRNHQKTIYVGIVQRNQHQQKHMPRACLSQKKRLSPFETNS